MLDNEKKLTIVIPNYNEEKTIPNLIEKLIPVCNQIIVIDDCSSDNSFELLKNYPIKVFKNEKRLGYEETLNFGFKKAIIYGSDYIITMDADNQHNVSDVEKIFSKIVESNSALVIGERHEKQRLLEHIFAYFTKKISNIEDPLSGLKAINVSKIGNLDHLKSPFCYSGTSILLHCLIKRLKVEKIKNKTNKRHGKSKYGNLFSSNLKILFSFLSFIKEYKKI